MQVFGRFAGQIATEFRDAVVTITELSSSVLEQLPSATPARRDVESIHTAAERAALLTQQLLSLSRAQPAEPKLLDLNTVITDRYDLLRHVAGKNIRLKTALDPALGTVLSDRSQFEQLLLNLIANAAMQPRRGERSPLKRLTSTWIRCTCRSLWRLHRAGMSPSR